MGSGKTYIVGKLSQELKFPLLIICTGDAKGVWENIQEEYGLNVLKILTYNSLRSKKGITAPKHGLLLRVRRPDSEKDDFVPTKTLIKYVEDGCLIVLDECQKLKNASGQNKACRALSRAVLTYGGKSRMAFLSALVLDKEAHAANFEKVMGFVTYKMMYKSDEATGTINLLGTQELIDTCRCFNASEVDKLLIEYPPVTKKNIDTLNYQLFLKVIMENIASSMPMPDIPKPKQSTKKN